MEPSSITVPTDIVTSSSFTVSWGRGPLSESYRLQESKNGGTWKTVYTGTGRNKTLSGRSLGDYTYRVEGKNSAGSSGWRVSTVVKKRVVTPVPSISGQSDPYDNTYKLSWNAVSGAGGYWIVGMVNGGCTTFYCLQEFVPASQTSIQSTALRPEFSGVGTYQFWLLSCDANGQYCNGQNPVKRSITVSAIVPPSSISVPTSNDLDGSYSVSWPAVSSGATYRLEEIKPGGGYGPLYFGPGTSKSVSGRAVGSYQYRVRAENANGQSGWRYSTTVTVLPAPSTPSSLSIPTAVVTTGSVNVSWGSGTHAETYQLERSSNGATGWVTVYNGAATSYTDEGPVSQGLAKGDYLYRVRSINSSGLSGYRTSQTAYVRSGYPTVSLSAPANGAQMPTGVQRTISASASDGGGFLKEVEFFVDGQSIGKDTSAPYQISWTPTSGTHQVFARAYDTAPGRSQDSAAISLEAGPTPPAPGSVTAPGGKLFTTGYRVSWSAVTLATGYTIEEQYNSADSWRTIESQPLTYQDFVMRPPGVYRYRVRAYNGFGSSEFTYSDTFEVSFGSADAETSINSAPAPAGSPGAGSSTDSDQVGAISGSFAVGPNGDATYSIPFVVAPGTAGVTPQIGLRYSSSAGNGVAGMGTSLTGLSSIVRCRQTLSQDDAAEPISFTETDRFCLDGQRLVLVSNSLTQGAEFRTEIDSYRRITAHGAGTANGDPDYFKVEAKDGSISYFGDYAGNDARRKLYEMGGNTLSDKVMSWHIARFQDSVGNRISYEYDAGHHNLSTIRYAYGGSSTAGARLEFSYQDRPDTLISYVSGYQLETPDRLSRVVAYNNGATLREYHFDYLPYTNGGYSRLEEIRECLGSVCLQPTHFSWAPEAAVTTGFETTQTSPRAISSKYVGGQPADLNGDGYMDLLWVSVQSSLEVELNASLYDASTGQYHQANCSDPFTCGIPERFELSSAGQKTWRAVDFNGDGSQDVSFIDKYGYLKILLTRPGTPADDFKWEHLYYTGISLDPGNFDPEVAAIHWADMNADGLPDLLYHLRNQGLRIRFMERVPDGQSCGSTWPSDLPCAYRLNQHNYTIAYIRKAGEEVTFPDRPAGYRVIDFDGDGRVDLFGLQRAACNFPEGELPEPECETPLFDNYLAFRTIGKNDVSKKVLVTLFDASRAKRGNGGAEARDLNGDGLADVLYVENNVRRYQLSNGVGFDSPQVLNTSSPLELDNWMYADVNRDGFTDIVAVVNPGGGPGASSLAAWYWDKERGKFNDNRSVIRTGVTIHDNREHMLFDVNSDGHVDWVDLEFRSNATERNIRVNLARNPHRATDKIERIDNGLGIETKIDYTGLNDPVHPDFYTRDDSAHERRWNLSFLEAAVASQNPRPPTYDIAPPMYVVRAVCTSSPAAGNTGNCNSGNAGVSRQSYTYAGAKLQGEGRGFLGFRQVRVDDLHSNTYTVTQYRQDFPYTGRPRTIEKFHDNGNAYSVHGIAYARNDEISVTNASAALKGKIYNTYTWLKSQQSFDPATGAALSQVVTVNVKDSTPGVDAWGNLVYSKVDYKNGGEESAFATVTTENDFGQDFSDVQRLGRLQSASVTHTRTGAEPIVRKSYFTYYTSGSHDGLLETESVCGKRNGSDCTVGEVGDTVDLGTTTHFYDSFGNKSRVEQVGTVDANGTSSSRIQYWEYEAGRYLKREQAKMGSTTVTTREVLARDPATGLPTLESDINGVETTSVYGALGRLFFQYSNTGGWLRSSFSTSNGNCPAGTAYVNTTQTAGGGGGITCYDALGREIMTGTIGFDGGYDRVDTVYNVEGQVVSQSNPYNQASTGATTNYYDAYGRLDYVQHPDNTTTDYAYSGLTTTVTNPKNQSRSETRNGKGELVIATDNGGMISYYYDATGNLETTTVSAGGSDSTTVIKYDALGRKTEMDDPDKGVWTYEYNQFGELIKQTNANTDYTELGYDNAGRKAWRKDYATGGTLRSQTGWTYDDSGQQGRLVRVSHTDYNTLNASYIEDLGYDSFGRQSWQDVTVSGLSKIRTKLTYDQYGRPFQVYGASNTHVGVEYSYNANGYRSTVRDSALVNGAQRTWYEVNSVDPRGNQTELTLYSGSSPTVVTRQYAADNGFLEGIHATSGEVLQDWSFSHDSIGNVMTANDDVRGDSYAYTYDGLNRLKSETINGTSSSFEYHANGNIDSKAGQTYTYGSSRPHAVTDVGGTLYDYDDNGNVTSGGGRTVEYTVFDKPHTISKSGNIARFAYGPGRGRFKQVTTVDGNTVTKYYVAGLEILHDNGSGWEYRRSIDGVAQETTYRDNSNAITRSEGFFYLRDHLGSVDVILNESGFEATDMRFGAWGERRNADVPTDVTEFPDSNLGYLTSITDRGFTGHEMLDAFGLVHMNGRVYDPELGRFLSADTIIQFPRYTQSYNRYSYVLNSPTNFNDPSGHFLPLVAGGIAALAGAKATTIAVVSGVASFGQSLAQGGDIGTALVNGIVTGVSSFAFASINGATDFSFLGVDGMAGQVLAMGTVGGTAAVLQGGRFGHGFFSAAVGGAVGLGPLGGAGGANWQIAGKMLARVAIGGTVSRITGGKFANGAASAAFVSILSEVGYYNRPKHLKMMSPQIDTGVGASGGLADITVIDEMGISSATWDVPLGPGNLPAYSRSGIVEHVSVTAFYGGPVIDPTAGVYTGMSYSETEVFSGAASRNTRDHVKTVVEGLGAVGGGTLCVASGGASCVLNAASGVAVGELMNFTQGRHAGNGVLLNGAVGAATGPVGRLLSNGSIIKQAAWEARMQGIGVAIGELTSQ